MPGAARNLPQKSRYRLHVEKWSKGCGSELCSKATNRVFARGTLPCDVLFVGEAPGPSEDVLGKPFVGPAGKLMDQIIASAWAEAGVVYSHAFYNLLGCIPLDEGGAKQKKLDHDCVMSCQPRLREFLDIAKPKLVVCIGSESKHYFDQTLKASIKLPPGVGKVEVVHPAAILRAQVVQQGLMVQQCVVDIAAALDELHGRETGQC